MAMVGRVANDVPSTARLRRDCDSQSSAMLAVLPRYEWSLPD